MGPLACCGCLRLGVLPWPLGCFPGLWAGLGPGGAAIGLPFFCCFAGPPSKGPSCETVPSPTPSAQAPFERTARGLCSCGCAWGGRRIRARAWVVNSPRVALCLSVSCPFAARGAPVPGCPPKVYFISSKVRYFQEFLNKDKNLVTVRAWHLKNLPFFKVGYSKLCDAEAKQHSFAMTIIIHVDSYSK